MLESNLIIHGLRGDNWELEENRREIIYQAISSTVDEKKYSDQITTARNIAIRSTKRLGKYRGGKGRPVSICFEKKSHADTLYNNRSFLPEGVFVDCEYTQEVEENRRVLKPILRLARSLNKYKGKYKLDGDTLIIQGTKYTASTIHLLPPDLIGFQASSKCDDKTIAFFGELNSLSNFHPCRFSVGNEEYHSSEQYIQQKKALFFGDETTAKRIMAANTAFDCLQISKNVHGYDSEKWATAAKEQALPGLISKFSSNPQL